MTEANLRRDHRVQVILASRQVDGTTALGRDTCSKGKVKLSSTVNTRSAPRAATLGRAERLSFAFKKPPRSSESSAFPLPPLLTVKDERWTSWKCD